MEDPGSEGLHLRRTAAADSPPDEGAAPGHHRDSEASSSRTEQENSGDEALPSHQADAESVAGSSPLSPARRELTESGSEGSADEMPQDQSYYDDSCSEHGEPLIMRGHRTRRQLKQRVEGLVQDLRRRREVLQRKQKNLAQSVNQKLRHQWLTQQERLVHRSKLMTSKLQSGRSRAWRHKWIFALVQADFVAASLWLGASPETYYLYYTAQVSFVIGCKILDYRVKAQHYFLLDFCFFANYLILLWLWVMPRSGFMYNGSVGVCGLLAISVGAFRNSCVPHDFVRISNAYVHFPAVICMLSFQLKCKGDMCLGMAEGESRVWYKRLAQAWLMYASWAFIYACVIFGIARERIMRKQRDTLYNYFAITLGVRDKLPAKLRPYSPAVFMLGHMGLFLCGIWWLFLPAPLTIISTIVMMMIFFHNGGRFYVDHFWKSYERNTLLYVDAASLAMSKKKESEE